MSESTSPKVNTHDSKSFPSANSKGMTETSQNSSYQQTAVTPDFDSTTVPENFNERCSISIVMPTYNRADSMAEVVRKTYQVSVGFDVEWIIIDDGSTDNTPAVLAQLKQEIPKLKFKSVENRGPGLARNMGASLARNQVILFIGDDILPTNEDFLRPHAEMHASFPASSFAVLGKALWPDNKTLDVGTVMRHIQGHGGEQFGYADFPAYAALDYRFFYTCNVSVKRDIVSDWLRDGFSSEFAVASWEDIEFAYRITKKLGEFKILYVPSSTGYHLHSYSVNSFVRRQSSAGAMAHVMSAIHPELGPIVRVDDIYEALNSPLSADSDDATADYLAVIEGLKAWARIMERERRLGNEAWHDDLLFIIFEVSYLQGYITAAAKGGANFAKAYSQVIIKVRSRLARILDSEVCHDEAFKARLLPVIQ
ncbi:glycosyltransferase [Opitutaceae bacterium]|nr:glycosyltransferase [Opitutaceae bacterium]